MSPSTGSAAAEVEVIDVNENHIEWIDEAAAHQYIREGWARNAWRRRGKTRRIQVIEGYRPSRLLEMKGRGSGLDHTRYAHKRETEVNPPRVWCLLRLGDGLEPLRG
jgi:hypothetical protein